MTSLKKNEPIIEVKHISKRYDIGVDKTYKTLSGSIAYAFRNPLKMIKDSCKPNNNNNTFWALKDVNFKVERGETLGIIGRNGAGKSTLLKILSRITYPTEGNVHLRGRVGSLLEVGTGFHPELTGRENIYFNGAILGMKKREIDEKFDEITRFSGVEKFLDMPVKRYSSGMQVRLAFSVAAHLEPEILLVDEVLAVGDAEFQKKCLGKMEDVAKEGRTVIFVSHNLGAVSQLCTRAVFLVDGTVNDSGNVERIISKYMTTNQAKNNPLNLSLYKPRKGTGEIKLLWVGIVNSLGFYCNQFSIGEDIYLKFALKSFNNNIINRIRIGIQIKSSDGLAICNMVDADSGFQIVDFKDEYTISVYLNDVRLYPDTYHVSFWVGSVESIHVYDHIEECLSFDILDGGMLTTRTLPKSAGRFFFTPKWEIERES